MRQVFVSLHDIAILWLGNLLFCVDIGPCWQVVGMAGHLLELDSTFLPLGHAVRTGSVSPPRQIK